MGDMFHHKNNTKMLLVTIKETRTHLKSQFFNFISLMLQVAYK